MDKIQACWRAQHLRSPLLDESLQPDRVKLVLPMVSLITQELDHALRLRIVERTNWNGKALVFPRAAWGRTKPC